MNKFTPSIKQAPTTPIAQSTTTGANSLLGMTLAEVVQACQAKITAGRGTDRQATGDTFLNMLTPKLFASNAEKTELHAIPYVYANFDNLEDSIAVQLATHLSTELVQSGEYSDLQYFFKLIDAKSKTVVASDFPAYEERDESESTVPDFLKIEPVLANVAMPDPKVCAYLHIYVEQNGKPVRIASSNIESRYAGQIANVAKLVKAGHHIQAGVVPMTKVANWLASQDVPTVSESTMDISDFTEASA